MLQAAMSTVAHSPLASGLSQDVDLGAIFRICDSVIAVVIFQFRLAMFSATAIARVLPPIAKNRRVGRRLLVIFTRILPVKVQCFVQLRAKLASLSKNLLDAQTSQIPSCVTIQEQNFIVVAPSALVSTRCILQVPRSRILDMPYFAKLSPLLPVGYACELHRSLNAVPTLSQGYSQVRNRLPLCHTL